MLIGLGLGLGLLGLVSAAAGASGSRSTTAPRPHIVFLFCDNVGWYNVGYHRVGADEELSTPNIDALAANGLELDRMYTYKFCSPSRSSYLSGRLPIHVNIYNDDPARPGAGIPVGMSLISDKLTSAGYRSHFIGKWHVGMATHAQTPVARGFASSLGYFHSRNDYFTQQRAEGCGGKLYIDLWDTDGPARGLNGTGPDGGYEEAIFTSRALGIIESHLAASPLYLYYAMHTSCVGRNGLQAPARFFNKLSFIDNVDRRKNTAMVEFMDESVGNITAALKRRGLWDNTLLVWSSDNGGAVHEGGGANAFPLRGGYENNWEGGVRVAALVSGGFLPSTVRGRKLQEPMHECDWYSTFARLAGVAAHDERAAAADPPLPPIDSIDLWDLISGASYTSPRREWAMTPLGESTERDAHGGDAAYMLWPYKLIVGRVEQSGWCGQMHPNNSKPWDSFASVEQCSPAGKVGCLFNVAEDPGEHIDLALAQPVLARLIYEKLENATRGWFDPDRGVPDQRACAVAQSTGFWGPFM